MFDWGINIFAFIVSILIIVGVHEFGHYWVAVRCGVKVLRFSIGFGKPLFRWRRGETEYVVGMIPLGGYVSMFGEGAASENEVREEDKDRAFNCKSLGARASIVAAGPLFNFILAILLYAIVYGVGREDWRPEVHTVAPNSVAAASGIAPSDEIVEIDGREVQAWSQVRMGVLRAISNGDESRLVVRDEAGALRRLTLDLSRIDLLNDSERSFEEHVGIYPWQPAVIIGRVHSGTEASASELREGDRVLALANQPVRAWRDFVRIVRANPDDALPVTVERDGAEVAFDLPIGARDEGETRIGYAGVSPRVTQIEDAAPYRTVVRDDPLTALVRAVTTVGDMLSLTLHALGALIVGEAAITTLSGPVTIAQYAGLTFLAGFAAFVSLMALISLSVGVINLLPIPMLDGGHLLYYLIEWIKGSPLSERARRVGEAIGAFCIAGLISVALYSDAYRLLS